MSKPQKRKRVTLKELDAYMLKRQKVFTQQLKKKAEQAGVTLAVKVLVEIDTSKLPKSQKE